MYKKSVMHVQNCCFALSKPIAFTKVQPRPQGFSLKKMGGAPHPFFKGKALGTRLTKVSLPSPSSLLKLPIKIHVYAKRQMSDSS